MNKKQKMPPHALMVREYEEFRQLIGAYAQGLYEFMAVVGDGGIGKSEIVFRTMQEIHGGAKWTMIRGKHTPLDLYSKLFQSRNLPVVLDDLDALLASHDNTALLKCVCDTRPIKRVEWGSNHKAFSEDGSLPKSFDSISKVCIIANDWGPLNRNVVALHNRGVSVLFRPDALEIHREVGRGGWFRDEEVFRFIGENLFLVTNPSFRLYRVAESHKRSGLNWKDLTLRTIQDSADPKLLLVAKLLSDQHYAEHPTPETAREQDFVRLANSSRATFYRVKAKLLKRRGDFMATDVKSVELQPGPLDLASFVTSEHLEFLTSRQGIVEPGAGQSASPQSGADSPQQNRADVIAILRTRLKRAIDDENYELAAELRDEIRRCGTE